MFFPPGVNDFRGQSCPVKGTHLKVWINKPTEEPKPTLALPLIQAA
jgi:hypothetical protein